MNASNLKELLQYCYISNKAVLINGKHGIGKSSIVKQFGNENNLNVEIFYHYNIKYRNCQLEILMAQRVSRGLR